MRVANIFVPSRCLSEECGNGERSEKADAPNRLEEAIESPFFGWGLDGIEAVRHGGLSVVGGLDGKQCFRI